MLETDRPRGEAVEVGSFDGLIAVAIDCVAEVVRNDEQDVRFLWGGEGARESE